ncbi:hypothetical protein [Streptomyces sp. NPDC127033]|uniref:hypothetical protein n=1 Tax=Streptomyces sp. NPDC127033 TaxID=3347110 RepID=UPI003662D7A1
MLLVVIGCAIGTAVNIAVAPPLRYRSAAYSIRVLARALYDVTSDMHPAMCEGTLDAEATARWRENAARTGSLIAQARADLSTAEENVHYNHRRLLKRYRGHPGFQGYESVLDALERTLYQLASLTRSLDQWREEENDYRYQHFLNRYASYWKPFLRSPSRSALWTRRRCPSRRSVSFGSSATPGSGGGRSPQRPKPGPCRWPTPPAHTGYS